MAELLLEINSLSRSFGGLKAVDDVSFEVEAGSIKSVIGPNGARAPVHAGGRTGFLSTWWDTRTPITG